jgi:lipopolysaccharide export system permease protein
MPLREVEITTTDEQDHIISRLSASEAAWDRQYHHWTFSNPVIGRFSQGKPPVFESPGKSLVVTDWPETPWLLIKPGLSPKYLGIPDLNTWLSAQQAGNRFGEAAPYETHWHHRWALPFTCLVTVLLASPLAIHFSRRGPGGGVFLAVVLSTLLMFTGTICLAFGEAGLMPPALAAWLPNLLFGVLGLYLFHRRITGRPIYQSLRRLIPVAP